jgi:hypothetical protein
MLAISKGVPTFELHSLSSDALHSILPRRGLDEIESRTLRIRTIVRN